MKRVRKTVRFGVRRGSAAAAGFAVLVLALSGCAGSSSAPGVATAKTGAAASASPSGNSKGSALKFVQCMRQHGVQMDDPDANGGIKLNSTNKTEGKINAAQTACQHLLPDGGQGSKKGLTKEDQAKFLKFAQCMRQHGIQMDDPDFSGGGVKTVIKGRVDQSKVDAAQKVCTSILPKGMQDSSGGPAHAGSADGPAPAGGSLSVKPGGGSS